MCRAPLPVQPPEAPSPSLGDGHCPLVAGEGQPPCGEVVGTVVLPALRARGAGGAVRVLTLRLYRLAGPSGPSGRRAPVGAPLLVLVPPHGRADYRFPGVPVGPHLELVATCSGQATRGRTARAEPDGWSNPFALGAGQTLRRDLRLVPVPWPPFVPPLRAPRG